MNYGTRVASLAAASALVLTLTPASALAAPCASRAELREQVAALRVDMRDDIASRQARSATADAVLRVIETFHGEDADNAAERESLGKLISAELKRLREARTQVERKALGAEIKALREQREKGPFTAAEREQLRAALAALRGAVLSGADNDHERRELARDFRALRAELSC
ncbi:MAG: hypothetical protein M3211_10120 [Actinomycetota bacterium]|nr:hypothetical protein [Actinomycetota bacterium]